MKFYTGVGSRKVPEDIYEIMFMFAGKMAKDGWGLYTGDAQGSDYAFNVGAMKENGVVKVYTANHATKKAMDIAMSFHPSWERLSEFAKKLHGINSNEVLGDNLDEPSKFLLCWTPDGCISHKERSIKTGGTGIAISIADYWNIPVFNLQREDHLERILRKING